MARTKLVNHCGPITLGTGNTYIGQVDVNIPGLGGGLQLKRTWNSVWPLVLASESVGIFGTSSRSTYEEQISMGPDNFLKYLRGDGAFWSFALSTAGGTLVPTAPANVTATLTQNSTNWILTFQDGEQRQFNLTTGLLTSITDRNGNTTQLTYNSSNQLTTVTSPASQHRISTMGLAR